MQTAQFVRVGSCRFHGLHEERPHPTSLRLATFPRGEGFVRDLSLSFPLEERCHPQALLAFPLGEGVARRRRMRSFRLVSDGQWFAVLVMVGFGARPQAGMSRQPSPVHPPIKKEDSAFAAKPS